MKKFLYAGSFDPFTRGHFDIVLQAVKKYECGVVVICNHPEKKTLFDETTRLQMIQKSLAYYDRVTGENISSRVEVAVFHGMTVDAALKYKANVLIRGVRNEKDYLVERDLVHFNAQLAHIRGFKLRQEHFRACDSLITVSSTAVKRLCDYGEYIAAQRFVFTPVHNMMMEYYLKETFLKYCLTAEQHRDLNGEHFWQEFTLNMRRPYHNLSHIAAMLNRLNIYQGGIDDKESLIRAIFYHDYDPNDVENSFAIAQEISAVCEKDKHLFTATDHFNLPQTLVRDERLIHDWDLSVLCDEYGYEDYRNNLRLEYSDLSLKKYSGGRLHVLTTYLAKAEFYVLNEMLQEKARKNVRQEINFWENVRRYGLPPLVQGLEKCD